MAVKNLKYALLLDVYGSMLSEKQRYALEMYYCDDLSLSEIADNIGITRQGVRDQIKHAEEELDNLDSKLGLIDKFNGLRKVIEEIEKEAENSSLESIRIRDLCSRAKLLIEAWEVKEARLQKVFQNLQERLTGAFKRFKNKGKLTEADVKEGMREIKLALLEADVSFKVVKELIKICSERAVGQDVLESLVPAQHIVKIVNEELTNIMGKENSKLVISSRPPTIVMMCGLQGAGKTTHTGKLALMYKKQGKRPLMAACDVYRPAAIKQLQVIGEQIDVPVFTIEGCNDPVRIAKEALEHANRHGHDMLFLDTAGRLHIDEVLMEELQRIKEELSPTEILFTVDAMTGQDAVNAAESFNSQLDITGVLLTKLDGDTRGGAALSVRYVTGKPIKFVGMGEKLDQIEPFYPDRMASRILGMGDVLSLIEKAEQAYDEKQAAELEKKFREQTFTLDDYLAQFRQIRGMGSIEQLMGMIPGVNQNALKDVKIDERVIDRMEAIILSMTLKERTHPEIINASRKIRIAKGSGMRVEDVNKLLKQYDQTNKMMKQFAGGGLMKKLGGKMFSKKMAKQHKKK